MLDTGLATRLTSGALHGHCPSCCILGKTLNLLCSIGPTLRKVIGDSEGRGVSKANFFKGKYKLKLKLNFKRGGRVQTKNPTLPWVWITK